MNKKCYKAQDCYSQHNHTHAQTFFFYKDFKIPKYVLKIHQLARHVTKKDHLGSGDIDGQVMIKNIAAEK